MLVFRCLVIFGLLFACRVFYVIWWWWVLVIDLVGLWLVCCGVGGGL